MKVGGTYGSHLEKVGSTYGSPDERCGLLIAQSMCLCGTRSLGVRTQPSTLKHTPHPLHPTPSTIHPEETLSQRGQPRSRHSLGLCPPARLGISRENVRHTTKGVDSQESPVTVGSTYGSHLEKMVSTHGSLNGANFMTGLADQSIYVRGTDSELLGAKTCV